MNFYIYTRTGVRRPRVSPGSLQVLAALWEGVRQAALACEGDVRTTVDDVLLKNQGEASTAFADKITGPGSSLHTLTQLSGAALRTRSAHEAAAAVVSGTQLTLDAVANRAAAQLVEGRDLPFVLRIINELRVLSSARSHMLSVSDAAREELRSIYSGVDLPVIEQLSYEQGSGTILPELGDKWSHMTTDERIALLDAVYDDITDDVPEGDLPTLQYFSAQEPLPEGTVPRPGGTDPGTLGWYSPDENAIMIDFDRIDATSDSSDSSPGAIHTMVHEVEHSEQHRLRRQYEVLSADPELIEEIRRGERRDPFVAQGTTLDEIERIKLQSRGPDDPYWKYKYRPGEIGARRSGIEYLDGLTPEKLDELTS